jgi:hypothetical protein
MFEILRKLFLASPAILIAALTFSSTANAENVTKAKVSQNISSGLKMAQVQPDRTNQNSDSLIEELENYSNEDRGTTDVEDQVTSVNELKDVAPNEWAYEALRSLVERYGCIVGYPELTYRGNRALTRWEFAAGLNACMNTMERLIQENVAVLKEDIETLKRLMQEFEAELAALGARVDNLEGRVAFLEDHQFSTTTKLQGEVIFALTDSFGDGDTTQTIFGDRIRLTFKTSFTGSDLLVTRFAAGNLSAFDAEPDDAFRDIGTGETVKPSTPTTTQGFNVGDTDNDIILDWLAYFDRFEFGENFTVNTYLAASGGIWPDNVPTTNPFFFNYDGGNGALSTFANLSPIYRIGGGSGLVLNFDLGIAQFSGGYLAGGAANPAEGSGLFNGDYAAMAQLNFQPIDAVELGLTYVHGFHKTGSPIFGYGGRQAFVGTDTLNFAGAESDRVTNTYGVQASWRIVDAVSFSAYFAYGDLKQIGGFDSEYWTYGGGFAFPNLGKEGNLLGIFAGVQPYLGDATFGTNNKNPVHVEVFYKYQLTDNISIAPGAIWISHPEQISGSNDEIIGTLRTTFTF